jgi:four helix bundle protein
MNANTTHNFEDLHIYQRARELTNAVYRQTRSSEFAKDGGLTDPIRRAAVSVMSNIAEGFERGTTPEFIQFLYIAKGSCGEVRAQLQIALVQAYITAQAHDSMVDQARRTSGMISNFIAHLQQTDYPGEKRNRPLRQAREEGAAAQAALRAAQLANIRAQERYYQSKDKPPALPSLPSSS